LITLSLPVDELFYSIQGEGLYSGSPSLFLRLGGCNLRCPGFGVQYTINDQTYTSCDSFHAVDKKLFSHTWKSYENSEHLLKKIQSTIPHENSCDIVITGGEPLLHTTNPLLLEIIEHLINKGFRISFETNATQMIDFERYPIYKKCIFALAVKLSNSGESQKKRINHPALLAFSQYATSFFKFVLDSGSIKEAQDEIEAITSPYPLIPIYCMPLGQTHEVMQKHDHAVFDFCAKHNYFYSDRIHIRIFGEKGGV
jgi:7-carboxy-7-deazaguanine synthase